jgi:hypothetical protein
MGDSAYDDVLLSRDLDDLRRFGFTLNHNNETKKEFGSYTDSVPDTATSTFTFCDSQATFHQSPSGKPSQNVMKSEKCDGTTTNSKISIDSEEKIRSQASSRSFTTTSDETRNSSSADDTRERKRPESQISIDDEPPSTLVLSPPLLSEFNEANKRMNNNNNAPMVASCVDSGIANTTSMDSELSALCMGAIASPSLSPSNKPGLFILLNCLFTSLINSSE